VLVTNHVLAGAAIGALVKRPLPALAIGVASHLAMDVIPHWGLAHDDRHGDVMRNPEVPPDRLPGRRGRPGRHGAPPSAWPGAGPAAGPGRDGGARPSSTSTSPASTSSGVSPFPKVIDRFPRRQSSRAGSTTTRWARKTGRGRRAGRPGRRSLLVPFGLRNLRRGRPPPRWGRPGGRAPSEPVKGRSEKVKMPPSSATMT